MVLSGAKFVEIVDEASTAPLLDNTERSGISANHSDMCKFEDTRTPGYRIVIAALTRYAGGVAPLIATRWYPTKTMMATLRTKEAFELA